jgi:hypothetical protein
LYGGSASGKSIIYADKKEHRNNRQTAMSSAKFKPAITLLDWQKILQALDSLATVINTLLIVVHDNSFLPSNTP